MRLDRVAIKRDLNAGRYTLAEALEHPACQTMALFDLLCAQHRWGNLRATRLLERARVGRDRRVGHLTDRQRDQVAAFAGGAGP